MTDTDQAAPGSRRAASESAQWRAAPNADDVARSQPAADQQNMVPVPVTHQGPVRTVNAASRRGNYSTAVLAESTALAPAVVQLLPRDDERIVAWITVTSGDAVLATSLEEAQNPMNTGTVAYSGAYIPSGTAPVEVRHREPVWAANASTSSTCQIAVMAETGGAV